MILLLALFPASMLVCWLVARSREADTRFWLLAGLLLGPIAIPFVLFSKPAGRNRPPGKS